MNDEQLKTYNAIMTTELDIIARQEYARKEGLAEGRTEGHKDVAAKLLEMGSDVAFVAQATGLTPEEILALSANS